MFAGRLESTAFSHVFHLGLNFTSFLYVTLSQHILRGFHTVQLAGASAEPPHAPALSVGPELPHTLFAGESY